MINHPSGPGGNKSPTCEEVPSARELRRSTSGLADAIAKSRLGEFVITAVQTQPQNTKSQIDGWTQ